MRAFLGTALHTPTKDKLEVLPRSLFVVDDEGCIVAIHPEESSDAKIKAYRLKAAGRLEVLGPNQYLLPGLVDLHVHAPQWPQLGKALDVPLETWLQNYTFPLEARYSDINFAASMYESLVDGLLANGTTTVFYFATIHLPATELLADICLRRGQRAFIGRVAMDDPGQCPSYYRDASAESAEADTRAFIAYVRGLSGNQTGLIQAVITPRFIPTCTDTLLRALGTLAKETGCHVQTHCSESDWEHGFVIDRCGVTDTEALKDFGLLSRRTVLAHGNFINDADIEMIRQAGAVIAHCPLSNVYLSDAVLPVRTLLDLGIHVGLGTDIAGGPSPSIFDSARHAVMASRSLESGVDPRLPRVTRRQTGRRIDAVESFWLATAGGGTALDRPIGLFAEGYQFDALLIDANVSNSDLRIYSDDEPGDVLQKIVYGAGRSNIRKVWVAGNLVHSLNGSISE
jgi:guanine deaminase